MIQHIFPGKRVLWAINVYSRVNHLRIQEELIRQQYGDTVTIVVYTGNELFDIFPYDSFHWKEDSLVRIPDDPAVHNTGGGHGGSHNGDRNAYNHVRDLATDYDYVIWTPADAIFSDYALPATLLKMMAAGNHSFMSCVGNVGMGRRSVGPRVHNEFFVVTGEFYRHMFPMEGDLEGYGPDGLVNECMERALGQQVHDRLRGRSWLVVPGFRHDRRGHSHMELAGGLGRICVENLFPFTIDFMKKYCPEYLGHVQETCFPGGYLHDVRPNYDCTL